MGDAPVLISNLLTVIDKRDWTGLTGLVTDDVIYYRPGCPPIEGAEAFVGFYRQRCIVSAGRHQVDRSVSVDGQGFCWGRFDGMSHAGVPLNVFLPGSFGPTFLESCGPVVDQIC